MICHYKYLKPRVMIPMPYRVRRTKSTTRSSTSSTEGQLSGAWPSSSRVSSSQSLTSGERARESRPRTFYNSFSRSSRRSSICRTPKIPRNFTNYNFWSINQIRSIWKINPSKSSKYLHIISTNWISWIKSTKRYLLTLNLTIFRNTNLCLLIFRDVI